jgi:hypothetical protein
LCLGFWCRASRVTRSKVCNVIIRTKVTMAGHAPCILAHRHIQLYMNTHHMVFRSNKFPAHVFMQLVGHHEENISHWQVWIGLGFRVFILMQTWCIVFLDNRESTVGPCGEVIMHNVLGARHVTNTKVWSWLPIKGQLQGALASESSVMQIVVKLLCWTWFVGSFC